MKQIVVFLALALLTTGFASAWELRVSNVGSVMPFTSGMTNVHYNSGDGVRFGAYQDQTQRAMAYSAPGTSINAQWHNPHQVAYHGSGNAAHRTLQPQGWQMQSATVRTDQFGMHVQQSPRSSQYHGTVRAGTPPSSVFPTTYRQPQAMHNPWGVQSNHYSTHRNAPVRSAYIAGRANYW